MNNNLIQVHSTSDTTQTIPISTHTDTIILTHESNDNSQIIQNSTHQSNHELSTIRTIIIPPATSSIKIDFISDNDCQQNIKTRGSRMKNYIWSFFNKFGNINFRKKMSRLYYLMFSFEDYAIEKREKIGRPIFIFLGIYCSILLSRKSGIIRNRSDIIAYSLLVPGIVSCSVIINTIVSVFFPYLIPIGGIILSYGGLVYSANKFKNN